MWIVYDVERDTSVRDFRRRYVIMHSVKNLNGDRNSSGVFRPDAARTLTPIFKRISSCKIAVLLLLQVGGALREQITRQIDNDHVDLTRVWRVDINCIPSTPTSRNPRIHFHPYRNHAPCTERKTLYPRVCPYNRGE